LDSASQDHFVTEHLVQQLHLRKFKAQIPVEGINPFSGEFIITMSHLPGRV